MSLNGSFWTRRADGISFKVVADPDAGAGAGFRSVRIRNLSTGREFWGTPEGLSRKYRRTPGSEPETDES